MTPKYAFNRPISRDHYVTIAFREIIRTTPKGTLVNFAGKAIWVPTSQIVVDDLKHTITMPQWIAIKNGIPLGQ